MATSAINLQLTTPLLDWQTRQRLQHEAEKPYSTKDFLGLQDYKTLMTSYSSSSLLLEAAWSLISQICLQNANVRTNLVPTSSGLISSALLQESQFQTVFMDPSAVLGNPASAAQLMASSVNALS